jgi:hypothetical protein
MARAELRPQSASGEARAAFAGHAGTVQLDASGRVRFGPSWVYAFIAIEFICQLALLVPALAPARVIFRSAALGSSLVFLVLIPAKTRHWQAVEWFGLATLMVVSLSALNPGGGAPLAVLAHWGMYLAVLSPLLWTGRLALNERTLGGLLICLWVFHFASSVTGVLQVAFPGRFQPALTTFVSEREVMMIRLASGTWVTRPMGLTDTPGGAGPSGFYATLLGLGIVLLRPFPWARFVGVASMLTGMVCIYLSQVRVALVLLFVCFTVLVALLMLSGRISGLIGSLMLVGAVMIVGFEIAFAVGGEMMSARVQSLIESPPLTVYQTNRGFMLDGTFFTLLPDYPLGAGLGHWGMMNAYFGSREHEIGAELQWTGWVLDGGFPLIVTYVGALLAALWIAVRESLRAVDVGRRCLAAVVAAYDIGVIALCFSYAPFMGATGIEFWLLNGVLLCTSTGLRGRPGVAWRGVAPVQWNMNARARTLGAHAATSRTDSA